MKCKLGKLSSRKPVSANVAIALFVTLLVAVAFPVFDRPYDTMNGWADQSQALTNFEQVLSHDQIDTSKLWAGPGWLAFSKLFVDVLQVESRSALIAANRTAYLLAVFLLSLFISQNLVSGRSFSESCAASLLCLSIVMSTNFTHFSNIPWSHFVSLPFAVSAIFVLSSEKLLGCARPVMFGFFVGIVATIRMFTAEVLILSTILWSTAYLVTRVGQFRSEIFSHIRTGLLCLIGLGAGYALCSLILGDLFVYRQYDGIVAYPMSELMTVRLSDFPTKFVQLFVDPCFFTSCTNNNWVHGSRFLAGAGVESFRYPLILQVPAMVWAALVGLVVFIASPSEFVRQLKAPQVAIPLICFFGIVLGYSTALGGGGERLKFGYVRDFMDATYFLIFGVVTLASTMYGSSRGARNSHLLFILLGSLIFISIVTLQVGVKSIGFPRLSDYWIRGISAEVICGKDECSMKPTYITDTGTHYFEESKTDSVFRLSCGGDSTHQYGYELLSEYQYERGACRYGAELQFMPTITSQANFIFSEQHLKQYGGIARFDWFPPLDSDGVMKLGINGESEKFLSGDWSQAEKTHRWTDGSEAYISVLLDPGVTYLASFDMAGYVPTASPTVTVEIWSNEVFFSSLVIASAKFETYQVIIPQDLHYPKGQLKLELRIRDPRSPSSDGINRDYRKLGVAVRSVSFNPLKK